MLVALIDDADDAVGALRLAIGAGEPAAGILDPELRIGRRIGADAILDLIGDAVAAVVFLRLHDGVEAGLGVLFVLMLGVEVYQLGHNLPARDSASLYGTADGGVLANETPLSITIRRFLAARPEAARELFDYLLARAVSAHSPVAAGEFGADMQVELVNDGPVTLIVESK